MNAVFQRRSGYRYASGSRVLNAIARAVPFATAAASVSSPRMRSSGANGVPLLIPIEASSPRISGSMTPSGSRWITASSSSKNETSLAWMVLNSFSLNEMNSIAGGASASESG